MKRPHEEFGSTLPCAPPEINAAEPIAAGVAPARRQLAMPSGKNRRCPRGLRRHRRASGRTRSRSAPRWRQTGRRPGRSPASHSPPAGRVCDTGSPQPRQPRAAGRAEACAHGRRGVDGAAGRCASSRRRRRGRTGGRRPAAGPPQRRRPLPNRPRNRAAAVFRPARAGGAGAVAAGERRNRSPGFSTRGGGSDMVRVKNGAKPADRDGSMPETDRGNLLQAWRRDPFDKALAVRGHDARAALVRLLRASV